MSDTVSVTRSKKPWGGEPIVEHSCVGNRRSSFVVSFIEKFGAVACVPDGEDSAGRQAFRLATPQELVDRACETAQLMYDRFEEEGWLAEVPPAPPDDSDEQDK